MGTLLSFTILGVFTGAAYAIAASGLVLTYSGIDPEVGVTGGQASSGLINATDNGAYPTLRTFTFSFSTRY